MPTGLGAYNLNAMLWAVVWDRLNTTLTHPLSGQAVGDMAPTLKDMFQRVTDRGPLARAIYTEVVHGC